LEGGMNREAYVFLNSARVLHYQYLRLKAKRDELKSCLLPGAIRYDKDKVQKSKEDLMSKIISEIKDLEAEMAKVQHNKQIQIEKICIAISRLESEEEKTALTMRYVNRIPVKKIAEEMGYSEPTIYRFMTQGAEKMIKIIK
jgi:DNA-directed RNA polymerase specialized sigma subunit